MTVLVWRAPVEQPVTTLRGATEVLHCRRTRDGSFHSWGHAAGEACPYCTRADDAPDMDGAA